MSLAIKIEIIVKRGEIKKLFRSKSKISRLEIPSDKLDEDPILAIKPKRKIKGKILIVKLNPNFL